MTNKVLKTSLIFISIVFIASCSAEMSHSHHSQHSHHSSHYAGEEKRVIKSLSADDVATLKQGGGWGLAKVGELNGYPGAIHVLEMESEIALTSEQKENIQDLYKAMNAEAVVLGEKFVELEKALSNSFSSKNINHSILEQQLSEIGQVRASLRLVHLKAHLETPNILTKEQISLYNKLRGYSSNAPCSNIPKGHSVEMWKKHNGCL